MVTMLRRARLLRRFRPIEACKFEQLSFNHKMVYMYTRRSRPVYSIHPLSLSSDYGRIRMQLLIPALWFNGVPKSCSHKSCWVC